METLWSCKKMRWDPFAGGAILHDLDSSRPTKDGKLVEVTRDENAPDLLWLKLEFGDKTGRSTCSIKDKVLQEKVFQLLLSKGIGKRMGDILAWAVPT